MGGDYPYGTYTSAAIPLVAVAIYAVWRVLKGSRPFSPTIPSYKLTRAVEADVNNDPR